MDWIRWDREKNGWEKVRTDGALLNSMSGQALLSSEKTFSSGCRTISCSSIHFSAAIFFAATTFTVGLLISYIYICKNAGGNKANCQSDFFSRSFSLSV